MKRHRFDPLSFVFGVTFLAVSLVCSPWLHWTDPSSVSVYVLRWIGIGFLLFLGVVLLATAGRKPRDLE